MFHKPNYKKYIQDDVKEIDLNYLQLFIIQEEIPARSEIVISPMNHDNIGMEYQKRFHEIPSANVIELNGVNVIRDNMVKGHNWIFIRRQT